MGGRTLWVVVHCGWSYIVGGRTLWVIVHCGWSYIVGGRTLTFYKKGNLHAGVCTFCHFIGIIILHSHWAWY